MARVFVAPISAIKFFVNTKGSISDPSWFLIVNCTGPHSVTSGTDISISDQERYIVYCQTSCMSAGEANTVLNSSSSIGSQGDKNSTEKTNDLPVSDPSGFVHLVVTR